MNAGLYNFHFSIKLTCLGNHRDDISGGRLEVEVSAKHTTWHLFYIIDEKNFKAVVPQCTRGVLQ